MRRGQQWNPGDFSSSLFGRNDVESAAEDGQVVWAKENIIHGEPGWPEGALEPGVLDLIRIRVFVGYVEVDHPEYSPWFEHSPRIFNSGKPVGNHGERITKCDQIHRPIGRVKRCGIGMNGRYVRPALLVNALVRYLEQGGGEVYKLYRGELL